MDKKIIEFVRKNRFLIDNHPGPEAKMQSERKWKHLAATLNVSVAEVKKRWNTLRVRLHRVKTIDELSPLRNESEPKSVKLETESSSSNSSIDLETPVESETKDEEIFISLEKTALHEIADLVQSVKSLQKQQTAVKMFFEGYTMQVENANLSSDRFFSLQVKVLKAMEEELEQQIKDDEKQSEKY